MRMLALLLFVVAVVEGFVIWTLWTHRAPCAPVPGASPQALLDGGAGGAMQGGSGNDATQGGTGTTPPLAPASPAPSGAASDPGASPPGANGNARVSGDLNQVPDPNCVAKTTASLLSSDRASAGPSCAPMSPPPQLRKAAKQLQDGSVPASSP